MTREELMADVLSVQRRLLEATDRLLKGQKLLDQWAQQLEMIRPGDDLEMEKWLPLEQMREWVGHIETTIREATVRGNLIHDFFTAPDVEGAPPKDGNGKEPAKGGPSVH